MNDKRKSNSVVTHSLEGNLLQFNVKGAGEFTLDMAKLHPDVLAKAAIHGLIQRISDRAAIDRDGDTGLPASAESKMARMRLLAEHYMSGSAEWSTRIASEKDSGGITIEAVSAWKGKSASEVRVWVESKSASEGIEPKEVLRKLASLPEVIREIAKIRAAKAPKIDLDLEGL